MGLPECFRTELDPLLLLSRSNSDPTDEGSVTESPIASCRHLHSLALSGIGVPHGEWIRSRPGETARTAWDEEESWDSDSYLRMLWFHCHMRDDAGIWSGEVRKSRKGTLSGALAALAARTERTWTRGYSGFFQHRHAHDDSLPAQLESYQVQIDNWISRCNHLNESIEQCLITGVFCCQTRL